jgi:hypothetical protein
VKGSATRRLIPASLILAATLVAIPLPANADPPETVGDIAYNVLPACDDFDVSVTGTGSKARVHEAVNGGLSRQGEATRSLSPMLRLGRN